jgi:hypothetical protein
MNRTDKPITIVIVGTDKSNFLSPGESRRIVYQPNEPFREGVSTIADLFQNTTSTATVDGDQLTHFIVSDCDYIAVLIRSELIASNMNADRAIAKLLGTSTFINYEPNALLERINEILSFEDLGGLE